MIGICGVVDCGEFSPRFFSREENASRGVDLFLRRRMKNTAATISRRPRIPPTTPPAMAPALDLPPPREDVALVAPLEAVESSLAWVAEVKAPPVVPEGLLVAI